jgi:hypothetical protein
MTSHCRLRLSVNDLQEHTGFLPGPHIQYKGSVPWTHFLISVAVNHCPVPGHLSSKVRILPLAALGHWRVSCMRLAMTSDRAIVGTVSQKESDLENLGPMPHLHTGRWWIQRDQGCDLGRTAILTEVAFRGSLYKFALTVFMQTDTS